METSDLIAAYALAGQKIDVLWNFYVTVHLAIAGFLLLYPERIHLGRMRGGLLVISYLAFSVINFRAKLIEYQLIEAVVLDLQETGVERYGNVNAFFQDLSFDDRNLISTTVHVVAFVIILLFTAITTSDKR